MISLMMVPPRYTNRPWPEKCFLAEWITLQVRKIENLFNLQSFNQAKEFLEALRQGAPK
jgi:hypothetical protein